MAFKFDLGSVLGAAVGGALLQDGIENQLDEMEEGDVEVIKAPAAVLIKSVIKRNGYKYDIVGYELRKRK